ncbi:MAG: hypothetical protein ABI723_19790 [Bacteroidia bacterium]
MMKTHFEKTMEKLSSEKEDNIQKLSKLSFDKLNELRSYYFELYRGAEETGFKEAAKVHYYKYLIYDEAIEVKQYNEEQTWDSLS